MEFPITRIKKVKSQWHLADATIFNCHWKWSIQIGRVQAPEKNSQNYWFDWIHRRRKSNFHSSASISKVYQSKIDEFVGSIELFFFNFWISKRVIQFLTFLIDLSCLVIRKYQLFERKEWAKRKDRIRIFQSSLRFCTNSCQSKSCLFQRYSDIFFILPHDPHRSPSTSSWTESDVFFWQDNCCVQLGLFMTKEFRTSAWITSRFMLELLMLVWNHCYIDESVPHRCRAWNHRKCKQRWINVELAGIERQACLLPPSM